MKTATTRPLATVTLRVGEPVYCLSCQPKACSLGVTTPHGFRTMRSKHTYLFGAGGILTVVCGFCGDMTLLTVDKMA